MKKKVKILWTGGYDSTYRIVELSFMDVIVETIYITGDKRKSEKREIDAMNKILSILQSKDKTKAEFLPIQLIDKSNIGSDPEISKAYNLIYEKTKLGSQHEWLAIYAKNNPGLEIGTEAGSPKTSHIIDAISQFGALIKFGDTYIWIKKHLQMKRGLY